VLSVAYGGRAKVKRGYCRFYVYRPRAPRLCLLCGGGGIWPHCPDLERCLQNPPQRTVRTGGLAKFVASFEGALPRGKDG
jgi:hypothetical protein